MSKTWKLNENTRKAIKRRIESGDLRLGGPSVSIGEHVYAIRYCDLNGKFNIVDLTIIKED